jgi:hypothetical protein
MDINRNIAERSLEWRDDHKLSFIWDTEIVIAYVNKTYKKWYILTDIHPNKIQDVNRWLGSYLKKLETSEEEEEADEQTSRQKVPKVQQRYRGEKSK